VLPDFIHTAVAVTGVFAVDIAILFTIVYSRTDRYPTTRSDEVIHTARH
jgi:hypothetical protein